LGRAEPEPEQHRQSLLKIDLWAHVIAVGHGEPAQGDQIDTLSVGMGDDLANADS